MFRAVLVLAVVGQAAFAQYGRSSGSQSGSFPPYEATISIAEKVRPLATTWTPGANPLPPNLYRTGAKREDLEKHRLPLGILVVKDHIVLPERFDARDRWPECTSLKQIRNQGCCGSCWAISAAETFTDRWCIHSEDKDQFSFGAYDLLSCCHSCGDGCQGGNLGPAWQFWVQRGVSSGGPYNSRQGCHPYPVDVCHSADEDADTPKCTRKCQSMYNVTNVSDDRRFGRVAYSVSQDEERIKEEIFRNGPVQASFDVYLDFKAYKTGVYRHVFGPMEGGHAVKMIGWGVENGTKYWLCSNSWGEDWGERGFFKIVRGENHCGIESDVHAGLPHYAKRDQIDY
ncbi:cathepsin B [Culex quinquefasciatus]|uniref:cathepsin B n=1 Tax=Culex quinquefasciatus TaxID=7176 RepID=UPI0018E2A69B|nr:cathepsin B [Culex quinquefasciatus]